MIQSYNTDPYLTDVEGAEFFGFSKATFRRRVADGTIPPPVKIVGTSRWPLSWLQRVRDEAEASARQEVA